MIEPYSEDTRFVSVSDSGSVVSRTSISPRELIVVYVSRYAIPLLFALVVLLIWELGVIMLHIPDYLLPRPSAVLNRLVADHQILIEQSVVTLIEAVLGFVLASTLGMVFAILIASSRILERTLYPYAVIAKVVPIVAIAPLLMIWLGFGIAPKIVIAAIISFFPIVVNTVKGLKSTDERLLQFMRSLSASPSQIFVKVRLPYALPYIFAGLRISITLCVVGAIVGELVGADKGLGHMIMIAQAYLDTEMMFAAVVASATLGIVLFVLVGLIENRILYWHESLDSEHLTPR